MDGFEVRGEQYSAVPRSVFKGCKSHAVHLYAVLSGYIGAHESGWPSRKTLAKDMQCSIDTVDRATKELVAFGVLSVQKRHSISGAPTSSLYTLFAQVHAQGSRSEPQGVAAETDRGSRSDQQEVTTMNQLQLEVKPSLTIFEQEFERIWIHYPRKIAKVAAKKAFIATRRKHLTLDQLMNATVNYALTKSGDDLNYVMHGSTFFGPNEEWRDYVDGGAGTAEPKKRTQADVDQECEDVWQEIQRLFTSPRNSTDPTVVKILGHNTLRQLGRMPETDLKAVIRATVLDLPRR